MKIVTLSKETQSKLTPILERLRQLDAEYEEVGAHYRGLLNSEARLADIRFEPQDVLDFSEDGQYLYYMKVEEA